MNKTSLVFNGDASGRRFATMAHDESTENQPGVIGDIESFEKLGRVCETDSARDGYSVLQKCLAKLKQEVPIRAGSYLLFGGNSCLKFSSTKLRHVFTNTSKF